MLDSMYLIISSVQAVRQVLAAKFPEYDVRELIGEKPCAYIQIPRDIVVETNDGRIIIEVPPKMKELTKAISLSSVKGDFLTRKQAQAIAKHDMTEITGEEKAVIRDR